MFSTKLMDDLASVLGKIMHESDGPHRAVADEIREQMEERDALDHFEEFLSWFPIKDAVTGKAYTRDRA